MSRRAGRPRKPHGGRNISGLRNQRAPNSLPLAESSPSSSKHQANGDEKEPSRIRVVRDSNTRVIAEDQVNSDAEPDIDDETKPEDLSNKLTQGLAEIASGEDDGGEWVPKRFRAKRPSKPRQKEYIKGPDVMSKSIRTQQRYRKSFVNQSKLDSFFSSEGGPSSGSGNVIDLTSSPETTDTDIQSTAPVIPQRRKASRSPERSDNEAGSGQSDPPMTNTEPSTRSASSVPDH
ncbi:hypothetical protein K435DRAFT_964149 [Dendrothele bispora CBS 962.96]|uniref:Uncharacterized protein n=1 Tax=Dendrothele bispora (strain CBS 962.96) TaxID=1314807 RepID=A0A4S8MCH9_DENBC|nr:hypothetical protein K435DRAFT_964149 [Dendrothele bispora CBS 962.96]